MSSGYNHMLQSGILHLQQNNFLLKYRLPTSQPHSPSSCCWCCLSEEWLYPEPYMGSNTTCTPIPDGSLTHRYRSAQIRICTELFSSRSRSALGSNNVLLVCRFGWMLEPKYFIPMPFVWDAWLRLGVTTSTTTTATGEHFSVTENNVIVSATADANFYLVSFDCKLF